MFSTRLVMFGRVLERGVGQRGMEGGLRGEGGGGAGEVQGQGHTYMLNIINCTNKTTFICIFFMYSIINVVLKHCSL